MSTHINGFGSNGSHEVQYATDRGRQTVYVKRDVWFDRGDEKSRIVWAQHRSWGHDGLPAEDDAEGATLGSIVVTHPAVIAFIDQLGELLVNPARFEHGLRVAKPRT